MAEHKSDVKLILDSPEMVGCLLQYNEVAVNILPHVREDGAYFVQMGGLKGGDPHFPISAALRDLPEGLTLEDIAKLELEPFGEKANIFHVFIDGKPYKEGKKHP